MQPTTQALRAALDAQPQLRDSAEQFLSRNWSYAVRLTTTRPLLVRVEALPLCGWRATSQHDAETLLVALAAPDLAVKFVPALDAPLLVAQALAAGHALTLGQLFELAGHVVPTQLGVWRRPEQGSDHVAHAEFGSGLVLATNGDRSLGLFSGGRVAYIVRAENLSVVTDPASPRSEAEPTGAERAARPTAEQLAVEWL